MSELKSAMFFDSFRVMFSTALEVCPSLPIRYYGHYALPTCESDYFENPPDRKVMEIVQAHPDIEREIRQVAFLRKRGNIPSHWKNGCVTLYPKDL